MADRLRVLFASYHPIVWWMIGATMTTKVTQFMVFPFMALYMSVHTHATPGVVGLAVGTGALASTAFGFIGGGLADRFGRKKMMVFSMAGSAIVMIGYANARTILAFFMLSAVMGIVRTLFDPASSAMLTDVTEPQKRGTVFAMNYWAINVGASIGPILGGYFGTVATGWTFYLTAAVDLVYAVVILVKFPESKPDLDQTAGEHAETPQYSFRDALHTIIADRAFLTFLVGMMLGGIAYSQIETTLPQFLARTTTPTHAAGMFSLILASNAVEVVVLQIFLSKIANRYGIIRAMMGAQVLFSIGYFGMSMSHALIEFLVSMLVLTVGEIISFPAGSQYVTMLADERMRATYFGANNIGGLSFFIGPWLGGVLLHAAGGMVLFMVMAAMNLIAIPFLRTSNRLRLKQMQAKEPLSTQVTG